MSAHGHAAVDQHREPRVVGDRPVAGRRDPGLELHQRSTEPVIAGCPAPRKKMPGRPRVSKPSLGLRSRHAVGDRDRAGAVVAHEEHGATALGRAVAGQPAAGDAERHAVAVVVDGAAAAAAGRAAAGGVRAAADRAVAAEAAARDVPRHADAAQRPAVAADVAGEAAVGDLHREALVLRERADRAAADVGALGIAAVAGERRALDAQPPAADEDRPAAAPVDLLARRVALARRRCLRTTSRGVAWSWQCGVAHTSERSHVFM